MLKKLKFEGGFFYEKTMLELFKNSDRMTLIYGKNGSGKSTVSKAILKATGEPIDDILEASFLNENDEVISDLSSIHVFNEEYINSRVRLCKDGLNTIVLLGELGDLEDKIVDLTLKEEAEKKRNEEWMKQFEKLNDNKNPDSPRYCYFQINLHLSGDGNWSEREKIINDGKRNASVTDKVISSVIEMKPTEKLPEIKQRYEQNLELLNQIRKNESTQLKKSPEIKVNYDINTLFTLLSQKLERPELNEREQYIIEIIDAGQLEQINTMKSIFSKENTKKCPYCLRNIDKNEKMDLVSSIEKVLSKEIDIHEERLRKCFIPEVDVDFSEFEVLNSDNCLLCKKYVEEINEEIFKIREVILKKINHPYTPILDFRSDLSEKLEQYEFSRLKLQAEIDNYNDAVKRVGILKNGLSRDNELIAHYEVERDIQLWKKAVAEQKKVEDELEKSNNIIKGYEDELEVLKARKKNTNIAVDFINKSLRYVFFSKNRLEIKVEEGKYVLYSHGKSVKPTNVSVGERNIIALCYFFTEMIMNQEAKDGYSRKLWLFIDDPVSSFDYENKVGIMSFLKSKLSEVVKSNDESQVLVFTHDIQCLYDLQKIADEISEEYKMENLGHKQVSYTCNELRDKKIVDFRYRTRNEYSELLKSIYDYACGETEGKEMTIGNTMRRVLEAFSTFTYRKGIHEVSIDNNILKDIGDEELINYFKNLMYRLVLNGESHLEERTDSLEDMEYLVFLSDEERQRTAKEILCFIYSLNERHIMAHLEGKRDIKKNIQTWCNEIKSFNTNTVNS